MKIEIGKQYILANKKPEYNILVTVLTHDSILNRFYLNNNIWVDSQGEVWADFKHSTSFIRLINLEYIEE